MCIYCGVQKQESDSLFVHSSDSIRRKPYSVVEYCGLMDELNSKKPVRLESRHQYIQYTSINSYLRTIVAISDAVESGYTTAASVEMRSKCTTFIL